MNRRGFTFALLPMSVAELFALLAVQLAAMNVLDVDE
jgi:hypothetical protein